MPRTPDQKVVEQIKTGIVAMLEEKGSGLSFVKLGEIPGFTGNLELVTKKANIIFWQGVSIEAITALQKMKDAEIIEFEWSSVFTYCTEGILLRLPVAQFLDLALMKRGLLGAYETPHWLPVVFKKGKNFQRQVAA